MTPGRWMVVVALLTAGCRGEPRDLTPERLARMVDSLRPTVEQAVGLPFRSPPRSVLTTRQAVSAYLLEKLDKEFPAERRRGLETAYQLLGLIPDTLDLGRLLLALYTEQVAGFYDPDSAALFAVQGGDRSQLRLVMAHEMVHALQHQYLPLDSLLVQRGNTDALAAAQAVLEGHATLASIRVLTPGQDVTGEPAFWDTYREQVRQQQARMPVFGSSPLVLREGLVFPYVTGAAFVRWWTDARGAPLPSAADLPRSTEQVLHPDRYQRGDGPVALRLADSTDRVLQEDTLGELEIQILLAVWRGADVASYDRPLGWGGDRYRVVDAPEGPALVWYSVWDEPPFADRFAGLARQGFGARARPGYRVAVDRVEVLGRAGVRVVLAPAAWDGWGRLPAAGP